jgi:hypothetical protein
MCENLLRRWNLEEHRRPPGILPRREFIALLGGAAAWPLAARAQQQHKFGRVGRLSPLSIAAETPMLGGLRHGLSELGWIEGQNLAFELRCADGIATTKVAFPQDYRQSFTKYLTINFPAAKEVRYYYANTAALTAAKGGKSLPDGSVLFAEVYSAKLDVNSNPITDTDGFYVADKLLRYTAMERESGWGNDIPELLRNENWNYAIFTTAKQYQQGVNQAECLACHKPLSDRSYTFTLKELSTAK